MTIETVSTSVGAQAALSPHQLAVFNGEYSRRRKSLVIGYLWWFFLCGVGAHLFYYGRANAAWLRVALVIGGSLLTPVIIGFVPLGIGIILNVIDAFVMPKMNTDANRHVENLIMASLPVQRA